MFSKKPAAPEPRAAPVAKSSGASGSFSVIGSDVTITLDGLSVGNTSLTMSCEMVQEGQTCVRGKAVLVNIDPESRGKRRISDPLRARLAKVFHIK